MTVKTMLTSIYNSNSDSTFFFFLAVNDLVARRERGLVVRIKMEVIFGEKKGSKT